MEQGSEVKVGQVWEDMDKRMGGRQVKVMNVWQGKSGAWYADVRPTSLHHPTSGRYQRASHIAVSRMHPHATGFKLIKDAP